MSTKYTRTIRPIDPGPWEWNELSPDDPEWELCEVWQADGTEDGKLICSGGLGIANARLIAAAPELLECLSELISSIEDARRRSNAGDNHAIFSNMVTATMSQAVAAIAKATGTQP